MCNSPLDPTGGESGSHGRMGYLKDVHVYYFHDLSDERISGFSDVTLNMTWGWSWVHPLWGTMEIVNDEGSWHGEWSGLAVYDVYNISGTLHGSGAYEGLVAHYTQYRSGLQLCMEVSGFIVEPGH